MSRFLYRNIEYFQVNIISLLKNQTHLQQLDALQLPFIWALLNEYFWCQFLTLSVTLHFICIWHTERIHFV